jgi:hypothetical protein
VNRRRTWFGVLLGLVLAAVLNLLWPGAWRLGSTPRFLVTGLIVLVASAVIGRVRSD